MKFIQLILDFFYEIFLGCRHSRLTRPFTIQNETYKVCLDCGKQIFYSPVTMMPLSAREVRRLEAARVGELKVIPAAASGAALTSDHEPRIAA
jgi:DNA-directed RNA polymerase subunit RPC12/RpoP